MQPIYLYISILLTGHQPGLLLFAYKFENLTIESIIVSSINILNASSGVWTLEILLSLIPGTHLNLLCNLTLVSGYGVDENFSTLFFDIKFSLFSRHYII